MKKETIAILLSVSTFLFLMYDYIFIKSPLIGVTDFTSRYIENKEENGQKTYYQDLKYSFVNKGDAQADNLRFRIYSISLKDDSLIEKSWSDSLPNTLLPNTTAPPFGRDLFNVTPETFSKEIALIFDIDYEVPLLGTRNTELWYKYTIGSDELFTLLGSEKKDIEEKYSRIKEIIGIKKVVVSYMKTLLIFLAGTVVGYVATFFWKRNTTTPPFGHPSSTKEGKKAETLIERQAREKEEDKQRIFGLLETNTPLTVGDVKMMLGIPESSATRYFDELEKEGKVRQVGARGRFVSYERV